MFPIKAYLPQLVESLEDTDGIVRDVSRQSVVELFTGPTVTDAARADLKKEMTRRGVRKTIVDSVLQKLMSGGGVVTQNTLTSPTASENGDAPKKEYIPPSLKIQQGKRTMPSSMTSFGRTMSQSTNASGVADSSSRPASRMGGDVPITPTTETVTEVPAVFVRVYFVYKTERKR